MNRLDKLIHDAWDDCDCIAQYDRETGYVEYGATQAGFEESCRYVVETFLEEYEIILQRKLEDSGVTIDIDTLMDETQKEMGL